MPCRLPRILPTLETATLTVGLLMAVGCTRPTDVSLYVALDQEHSEQLVDRFEQVSGLKVKARFDTEGSKTVGLVSAILEERERPRCDVFWNNELAHTVRLAQKGVLASYESPAAKGIPAVYRDPDALWTGFGARARVIIVNTDVLPNREEWPSSVLDLVDPKWKGRCGVAKPLTGTTLTHFTALSLEMEESKFDAFLAGLATNEVAVLQSNGATKQAVSDGTLAWAMTDTDDFHVALKKGNPVACVFPDQGDEELGTMLIPNSVGIIKDCPHPENAKKLVDFIVSEEVEGLLAASRSAQIPLRASVTPPADPQILRIDTFKVMRWDARATAAALDSRVQRFQKRFGGS